MDWLNYNHLYYFWMVTREGSIASAARRLHMARPTVSMQIKSLEASVGSPLFDRHGRRVELTETGKLVAGYAEQIFRTGEELIDALRGRRPGSPMVFRVGIADVMAKLVAFQLLQPALDSPEEITLVCREDHPTPLFADLAVHDLDLVLSDIPMTPGIDVKAYNHVLAESTTSLFSVPELATRIKKNFPASLDDAPFLMPSRETAIRGLLEVWFESEEIRPRVVAEFGDSALMKVFGQAGRGVFPAPTMVKDQVCRQYGVRMIGELPTVLDRFYAISPERKIKHPAVAQIVEQAQRGPEPS